MLKIGVFGAGHLGKIHIRLILELKDEFELVGFYDPSDDAAEEAILSFGIKRFENVQDLLDAVDCVDIVTPTLSPCAKVSTFLSKNR
jgi:predicted dehydrogenase